MRLFMLSIVVGATCVSVNPCFAQQTPSTGGTRSIEVTMPNDVSAQDSEKIKQNVNRFFGGISISGGGTVTTPLGGGGINITIGRSGNAPAGATSRSVDISKFQNQSADATARDFLKDVACNAAAAAAAAACTGSGPVVAACLAAVAIARDECLK